MKQQKIHFYKMTGAGNDFILIDNRDGILDGDRCQDFVRLVCRHKLSVGADGLFLIENDPEVDFKWRFFNADASEAEMWNGGRCAARFAHLVGIVKKPKMSFRTLAGIIKAEMLDDCKVKVQLTPPHSLQLDIHVESEAGPFYLDFINTGVPHAVCFMPGLKKLELADIQRWGRAIRFHPRFQPAGANANFIFVHHTNQISIRTYERGVEGETLACGTGCTASALIAARRISSCFPSRSENSAASL